MLCYKIIYMSNKRRYLIILRYFNVFIRIMEIKYLFYRMICMIFQLSYQTSS